MIRFTFILILSLLSINVMAQTETQVEIEQLTATELKDKVEGTFYFQSPTGNMRFMLQSEIVALYPEILSLRQDDVVVFWPLNEDIEVVILPYAMINESDFDRIESPYNGPKKGYTE